MKFYFVLIVMMSLLMDQQNLQKICYLILIQKCKFFILIKDVSIQSGNIFKEVKKINLPRLLRYFSQFYRMLKYMFACYKLDKNLQFDVIIYNNALVGALHCLFLIR